MTDWPAISSGRRIRPSHITGLQDAIDGIQTGTLPIALPGIVGALGERNAQNNVANLLDYDSPAAAITALSTGGTLYLPPGLEVTDDLVLTKRMTISAYGATLSGAGVEIAADDVDVLGLTVDGAPTYGLVALGRNRTRIRDCSILDATTNAVFLETGGSVSIVDPEVSGCYIESTTGDGIIIHGNAGSRTVQGARIIGNTVRLPVAASGHLSIETWGGCPHSVIANNVVIGGSMGISVDSSDYSSVIGNTIRGPHVNGIEFAGTDYSVASGNVIDGNGVTEAGFGISNSSTSIVVTGNVVRNCLLKSLHFIASSKCTISGNLFVATAGTNCIYLQSASHVAVAGNTLEGGDPGGGVTIEVSTQVAVTGNLFTGFDKGVQVYGTSGAHVFDDITVSGNVFEDVLFHWREELSGGAALGSGVYINVPQNGETYTVSNVSTDRSFNANSTTTDELADVLGTLIADLRAQGILL